MDALDLPPDARAGLHIPCPLIAPRVRRPRRTPNGDYTCLPKGHALLIVAAACCAAPERRAVAQGDTREDAVAKLQAKVIALLEENRKLRRTSEGLTDGESDTRAPQAGDDKHAKPAPKTNGSVLRDLLGTELPPNQATAVDAVKSYLTAWKNGRYARKFLLLSPAQRTSLRFEAYIYGEVKRENLTGRLGWFEIEGTQAVGDNKAVYTVKIKTQNQAKSLLPGRTLTLRAVAVDGRWFIETAFLAKAN